MRTPAVVALTAAVTLGTVGLLRNLDQGIEKVLKGACTSTVVQSDKDTYRRLALDLVYNRLNTFKKWEATPATVEEQLGRIAAVRAEAPEKVSDKCLLQHVEEWLDYYERQARGAIDERARLGGYRDDYSKKRAEEEDAKAALKKVLGAQPL